MQREIIVESKAPGTYRPAPRVYPTPKSIEDAEARRRLLVTEVETIQVQLGDPQRVEKLGVAFADWRVKAAYSRIGKVDEIMYLKGWIKAARTARIAGELGLDLSAMSLLAAARKLILGFMADDFVLDADELKVFQVIDQFLNNS